MNIKEYDLYLATQKSRSRNKWARKQINNNLFKKRFAANMEHVISFFDRDHEIRVICMGCRDGTEVYEFQKFFPKAMIDGIDIADNIKTIQPGENNNVKFMSQDFNLLPDEWIEKYEIVYSNSLDHAFDPKKTVREWTKIVKPHGFLFLEISTTRENVIEHQFSQHDVDLLFPDTLFDKKKIWYDVDASMIMCLFQKKA